MRYRQVLLQVRNPLVHIAVRAASGVHFYVDAHAPEGLPVGIDPLTRLQRALRFYVLWHEHLLAISDVIYRVRHWCFVMWCVIGRSLWGRRHVAAADLPQRPPLDFLLPFPSTQIRSWPACGF